MLALYNFTWGEQPSGDPKYSNEYPLPERWQTFGRSVQILSCSTDKYSVVDNVCSVAECEQWITSLDGFEQHDVVTELGQQVLQESAKTGIPVIWTAPDKVRTNKRKIWQVPKEITDELFARLRPFLPAEVKSNGRTWSLRSINRRFRFFETSKEQEFHPHVDASSARLNESGQNECSFYTLVIWLNDDYTGGELKFADSDTVKGKQGSCIIFGQDCHPDRIVHQGLPVRSGCKYILRTDIFYGENL